MADKNYQMITFSEDELSLDVRFDPKDETVWLTQAEMAELFNVERPAILYHLRNIYASGELSKKATCKEILQVRMEGNRQIQRSQPIFNLDIIISVGYRVNSKRGIAFRRWASSILKDYLTEGYALIKHARYLLLVY